MKKDELGKAWALLAPYVRSRVPVLAGVAALGAVTAVAQASVLLLIEPAWSLVLFPGDGKEMPESAAGEAGSRVAAFFEAIGRTVVGWGWVEDPKVAVLGAVVVAAILLAIAAAAAQYGFTHLSRWVGYRMIVDLRLRLAQHLTGLSVHYHDQRKFGDLLSRLSSDVTTTLNAVHTSLKTLLLEPLMAMAALGVAFVQAPLPTLGILVLLPLAALPISRLSRKVRKRSTRSQSELGASVQVLAQTFQGIRTVKSFGGEERELERYRESNESYLRNAMRMTRAIATTHSWMAFFSLAGVALLVGVFGYLMLRFAIFGDAGQMTVFLLAIARTQNHAKAITRGLTGVQESFGAAVRIHELLEIEVDVVDRPDAAPIRSFERGLRFEGVSLRYSSSDENALSDVDLEIARGETVALVGESGAGKSTLIDLVARFLDPTEGRVTVDGRDLRDLRLADWTRCYALVGQVPFLFHASIAENIRYGRPEATDTEVHAAARAADIHDFVLSLPEGYDTDVADMGSRLSGGQRQRITIARAILKGAPLLLLDEATSALDSRSEGEVQRALDRLMKDRTVLVIAHRLSTVRRADRIVVLEAGRIVEQGRHEELVAGGGVYARLHALQATGELDPGELVPPVGGGSRGAGARRVAPTVGAAEIPRGDPGAGD